MERKISASIELQAIEYDIDTRKDPSCDPFTFSSCEVTSCYYEYPLKLMVPQSSSNSPCLWIIPIIFGGGLVEGDHVNISVRVGNSCCVLMTTISFPKVYCCENGLNSQQHVKYDVSSHSLLCVLPDPLVCYKNASYIQSQSFYLSSDANVVSLDWFTSGRYERGESWEFTRLKSASTFYMNEKLTFKENQDIQNSCLLSIKEAMKSYNCFGTCIVLGSQLSFVYERIFLKLGKCHTYGEKYQVDSLFAVSPLFFNGTTTGCIVRFVAESVIQAKQKIEELLEPLLDIFEENPFQNK